MKNIVYIMIISLTISAGAAALENKTSDELENEIVRLHIVADSDLDNAQEVKLMVRDRILSDVSLRDPKFLIKSEAAANAVLSEYGEHYTAHAYYGSFYFPLKKYKNITLPEGNYKSVRIVLGNGAGRNWWCVMYPPLCSAGKDEMRLDKPSEERLKSSISSECYELITKTNANVKLKFRTVELVRSLKQKLK
ncbi:MAG: stage II sporulation protein R [Clostridia bacterium]|nr:stage II sporulation protein R [Clostridia bacterium]